MKYMTATQSVMGGVLKILSLSGILQVYSVDRLYLSVAVMGKKYCVFDLGLWVRRKLITFTICA